jgi:hypothetical protein
MRRFAGRAGLVPVRLRRRWRRERRFSNQPPGGTGTGPASAFEEINQFTLQPTLKTLPQDGSVQISAVTADSITLSGTVPPLAPGDAILSNDTLPDGTFGLIRKVVSVSQNGADTVVQTQPGDLADVFQTAQIDQEAGFPAEAFENLSPGTPGISFGAHSSVPVRRARARGAGAVSCRSFSATCIFKRRTAQSSPT